MMKSVNSREKTLGLALAGLAVVAGCWAIYRFGPRPQNRADVQEAKTSVAAPNLDAPSPTIGPDSFSGLLQGSATPTASGRASGSVAERLDSLEAVYRRRGYQKVEPGAARPGKRGIAPARVYWRSEAEGFSVIGAWGEGDADPNSEPGAAKQPIYLTVVSPADGAGGKGSQWTTYAYSDKEVNNRTAPAWADANGDWPGQDPRHVPRPAGLQRRLSLTYPGGAGGTVISTLAVYQTQIRAETLADWYAREMALAGWRLDPQATSEAGEMMVGVLCFTSGDHSCLVWIIQGDGADPTSVVVSSRDW
jgi:hypothetical protein